jgi:hypothetical protein
MKQLMRVVILGALALVAPLQPARAICDNAIVFSSTGSLNEFTRYSYVETAGVAPGAGIAGSRVTARFQGAFWVLGAGNPDGGGVDDGAPAAWPAIENGIDHPSGATGWLISYASQGAPGAAIAGTWAQDPRIDGCPDEALAQPTCHATYLTDETGSESFFAVVTRRESADQQNYDLSLPGNAPITLVPVPKPRIVGSSRTGLNIYANIGAPFAADIAAGSYLDPDCAPALTGYRIYRKQVPNGSPAPQTRDRAAWDPITPPVVISQSTVVPIECSDFSNQDSYLTQTLVFEGGLELPYVSKQSTRIECGPNLAQPQQPEQQPRRPRQR